MSRLLDHTICVVSSPLVPGAPIRDRTGDDAALTAQHPEPVRLSPKTRLHASPARANLYLRCHMATTPSIIIQSIPG